MEIREDKNIIKKEFNLLVNLVRIFNEQKEKIEGKNGYLKTRFSEWKENELDVMINGREYNNIILNQEETEMDKIKDGDPNALHFFKPYFDDYAMQIANGNIPYFLRGEEIELKLDIDISDDEEILEKSQKEFINMPKEKRESELAKVYKELAIIYARKANILNRFKDSQNYDFRFAMSRKSEATEQFLKYAVIYNSKVPEEEQIAFGISRSERGPVLDVSLPGYTRLSVHFGDINEYKNILKSANMQIEDAGLEKYFPTYRNGNIDIDSVYIRRGYNLPKFDVINTGIINRMDYDNSSVYESQIRGKSEESKVNNKRLEMFANFMYPELNDRDIFFIAERAELGKKHLENLAKILEAREQRKKIAKNENKDIRSIYIEQAMGKTKDVKTIMKKINEFYGIYEETSKIKSTNSFKKFVNILKRSNIDEKYIEQFIKEKEITFEDMDFEEIVEIANNGKEIPKEIFNKKYNENEDLDFLYESSENTNMPNLNDDYFKTIWKNVDTKDKMILVFKTVGAKCQNEKLPEQMTAEEIQQSVEETQRIQEIVLNEIIEDEKLEKYGDIFVNIIIDSSELLKKVNIDNSSKDEQLRLVKNLWDGYKEVLLEEGKKEELSSEEKEEFIEILNSFWVDEDVINKFENSNTSTYSKMKEVAKESNVLDRNQNEQYERSMQEKGKNVGEQE